MEKNSKKSKRPSLYEEFDIKVYRMEQWVPEPHKHGFFEIVYVLDGTGTAIINDERIAYAKDTLFILTHEDEHAFVLESPTAFCIITFTKTLFSRNEITLFDLPDFSGIFNKIEIIFYNLGKNQQAVRFAGTEGDLICAVVRQLVNETEAKNTFHQIIVPNLLFLLLTFIARVFQLKNLSTNATVVTQSLAFDVINYIQEHLDDNKKLSLARLARHFGKSKGLLQQAFKAATGKTIKDFIIENRLNRVRSRLLYTGMNVSEIARAFGYIDESHLNKAFKKKYGMSPKKFRQANSK